MIFFCTVCGQTIDATAAITNETEAENAHSCSGTITEIRQTEPLPYLGWDAILLTGADDRRSMLREWVIWVGQRVTAGTQIYPGQRGVARARTN